MWFQARLIYLLDNATRPNSYTSCWMRRDAVLLWAQADEMWRVFCDSVIVSKWTRMLTSSEYMKLNPFLQVMTLEVEIGFVLGKWWELWIRNFRSFQLFYRTNSFIHLINVKMKIATDKYSSHLQSHTYLMYCVRINPIDGILDRTCSSKFLHCWMQGFPKTCLSTRGAGETYANWDIQNQQ